jgi:NAD(P)H-hydrate repair Nnr-like enzyme with NAD(P)H-hydrate dehydratase domain
LEDTDRGTTDCDTSAVQTLSGLIVALLAQGYTAIDAAIQGSLALVVAADQYEGSSYAMLPTDLVEEVGKLECAVKG